ncbi:MAG: DUF962 domain-containing protein [Aquabacterium sp.]|nr:DUF962 domain-containing protein [Aquabacterium sp.]
MKTLADQLSQYANYHRDHRNIWTHFIGIPMIVASVCIMAARPNLLATAPWLTPASVLSALAALYYLRLDLRYGLVLSTFLVACLAGADMLNSFGSVTALSVGAGMFIAGWIIQFIGHYFEGRKPAFIDDAIGLAIGPVFVVAELGFLIGLRRDLEAAIIKRAGALR